MKQMKAIVCLLVCGMLGVMQREAVSGEVGADFIELTNSALRVQVERRGGQFIHLQLSGSSVNPLSWRKTRETMPENTHTNALFKGHFLCMGHTGGLSPGEIEAGVPMRGGQTGRLWAVTKLDARSAEMECDAPLDELSVRRRVELDDTASFFLVTEWFKNTGALGRLNNVLQHVTIGPPFLSKQTLINSNAGPGFFHKLAYPDPHQYEYAFPVARLDKAGKRTTDLQLSSDQVNYLSRHIFPPDEPYGWVTAYDPVSGLVLGYVWKTDDYPWINIWQQVKDAEPVSKGLEFGTAGMDGGYRKLLESDARFHGIRSWEYIDAGETVEKSYLGFLIDIGPGQTNPYLDIEDGRIRFNGRIELPNRFKR